MKLHQWGWVVVLLGAAMPAAADQVDINFSGDAAAFSYIKPLQTEGLELGGRWLHDTEDGDIADANVHLVDRPEPGRNALVLGIGGKLPVIMDDVRDADGAALAIGGKLRWTLPEYNRAAVAGSIYYAPSATSVSDIDGYQEYSVRGEFQLLEDANVYLGFRHIELSFDKDSDGADRDFEDGVYAGFNIDF
ncbi:MAG: YfaZ family outer membrane protein [Spiribacter sp.]|nr:YfaZ family outer membrane protein [Spiribacter sp.]